MEEAKINDEHIEWAVKSEGDLGPSDSEQNESLWQMVKRNRWAILYCCCMTVSPMLYGFDVITVGVVTAMPGFQYVRSFPTVDLKNIICSALTYFISQPYPLAYHLPFYRISFGTLQDGQYLLPAMWLSLWTTMMPIGVMLGALSCSFLTDRFGTRWSTMTGGVFAIAGALLTFFSDRLAELDSRRGLFTGSKVVLGYGLGLMLPASQTYVSEVSPVRLRGALLSLFTISMVRRPRFTDNQKLSLVLTL